ncbi:hypothetical protein TWF225_008176 [Orbilia oligospora]|nr:hypothetical protein TWF225_008176 [Orbilia oligospora]KAF3246430.1 hypothetical protein TWF128_008895 [Orbilia oligospora]KAF3268890.1 hypothetical protein TWF217_010178 [Orbilia oligospora]KAF3292794.1 hypothetical protein TWF132_005163 [Orbilia oligospora]
MNYLTNRQGFPSTAPDRITVQSHTPPDLDSTSTTGTTTATSIATQNSSEMANQSPSLYKLIILRNDLQRDDWKDATVSIFDTNEDPTPENHPLLLFQLANYSSAALRFLERVVEQVNNSPLLEGTGCKYCPSAAVRYDTDPHGHHRGVILKLMNIERDFRDYSRGRDEPPSYTGSATQ